MDETRFNSLRRRVSKLVLATKRTPVDKWRQRITRTVNGQTPVQQVGSFMYPWHKLRKHTDDLIAKLRITGLERESLLVYDLIEGHDDKITALAACSHLLSQQSLHDVLSEFRRHGNATQHLQAFVAAAHGNYEAFPRGEEEIWAAMIIQQSWHIPSTPSMQTLVNFMASYPIPTEPTLQRQAKELVEQSCHGTETVLSQCRTAIPPDWSRAIPVAEALSRLVRGHSAQPFLLQSLDAYVQDWRAWAHWKPDQRRISGWRKSAQEWPNPFWQFLSPDFQGGPQTCGTFLERLVGDQAVILWLAEHNLRPGIDLVYGTPEDADVFIRIFADVMDLVCANGGIHASFLRHLLLDTNMGVDKHCLGLWVTAARHLFIGNSDFLQLLILDGPHRIMPLETVQAGLTALNSAACKMLRAYLQPPINTLLEETAERLEAGFVMSLHFEDDWIESACALNTFETILSTFSWLESLKIKDIKARGKRNESDFQALRELQNGLSGSARCITEGMSDYINDFVLGSNGCSVEMSRLIKTLLSGPRTPEHRQAAIAIVSIDEFHAEARNQLILDLARITRKQANKLQHCLSTVSALPSSQVRHRLLRIASAARSADDHSTSSWRQLVIWAMNRLDGSYNPADMITKQDMTNCVFKKYSALIGNIENLFGDPVYGISSASSWMKRLCPYEQVLQAIPIGSHALHHILTAFSRSDEETLIDMLRAMDDQNTPERLHLKHRIMLAFAPESDNMAAIASTITMLSTASDASYRRCEALVAIFDSQSVEVAAVQLQIWQQTVGVRDRRTQKLLTCLGNALHVESAKTPMVAKDYFLKMVAMIVDEARALEDMKQRLKVKDRQAVQTALSRLGIEDTSSPLEDETTVLPESIRDYVRLVDERTTELYFPLDRMLEMKCLALGVRRDESLVLRICTNSHRKRSSFCAHVVNPADNWHGVQHKPVDLLKTVNPPNKLFCNGRNTRLGYWIMRRSFHSFKNAAHPPLSKIYKGVELALTSVGSLCIVCAKSLGCFMHRAVICASGNCHKEWILSSLEVRLADVLINESAVELLLAAIHAAASINRADLDLLPSCPSRLNDHVKLVSLVDSVADIKASLVALTKIGVAKDQAALRRELLLSYACNSFRGFLTEATGSWIVPSLPGVRQFVVIDSPPEVSAAFAKWDHVQPRTVLFHGTSYDRLFAILHRGLIVCSHTALQRVGAAYGSGIYLAEQPATSMGYAAGTRNLRSGFATRHADLVGREVLLGVEYAGNDANRGHGIHVAPDASKCCVRYVFMCSPGFHAPAAALITPAMLSNYNTLKQGAICGYTSVT